MIEEVGAYASSMRLFALVHFSGHMLDSINTIFLSVLDAMHVQYRGLTNIVCLLLFLFLFWLMSSYLTCA